MRTCFQAKARGRVYICVMINTTEGERNEQEKTRPPFSDRAWNLEPLMPLAPATPHWKIFPKLKINTELASCTLPCSTPKPPRRLADCSSSCQALPAAALRAGPQQWIMRLVGKRADMQLLHACSSQVCLLKNCSVTRSHLPPGKKSSGPPASLGELGTCCLPRLLPFTS